MGFDGTVSDTRGDDWNFAHVEQDVTDKTEKETPTDPMAVYTNIAIGICIFAIVTNLAILVLIVFRAYHYRATEKWKWARLHLLGVLCVMNVFLMSVTLVTKFPEGTTWVEKSDVACKFMTTIINALQLVVLLYLNVIGIHTFFQVCHPNVLTRVWHFVISLMVHPVVWIVGFACGHVFFGRYTLIRSYNIFGDVVRFCVVDDPIMYGQWLNFLATTILLAILSYLTFISTVGLCLVKPYQSTHVLWSGLTKQSPTMVGKCYQSTDDTVVEKRDQSTDDTVDVKCVQNNSNSGKSEELLRWMAQSRTRACFFLAVITILALATRLPMVGFVIKHSILDEPYDTEAFQRRYILEVIQNVFHLMFPIWCLFLQEMGVYSFIKRTRK